MKAKKTTTTTVMIEISMEETEATALLRALEENGVDHPIAQELRLAGVTSWTMEEKKQNRKKYNRANMERKKKEKRREYDRKRYHERREQFIERANTEERKEYRRLYYLKNKEKMQEQTRKNKIKYRLEQKSQTK